jgi:hypothetical protein
MISAPRVKFGGKPFQLEVTSFDNDGQLSLADPGSVCEK